MNARIIPTVVGRDPLGLGQNALKPAPVWQNAIAFQTTCL
jgi:hypothetical protein